MSADEELEEIRRIIAEEKETKRQRNRETTRAWYARMFPTKEARAEYRQRKFEEKSEEERAAIRKYNTERQRAYLAKVKPTWPTEEKKRRNRMTTEAAIRKRVRLAGRPKPETCEVCGRGGKIVFEHRHTDNKFRGWTCDRCNVALGMVEDDISVLEKLIIYLKAHQDDA